MDTDHPVFQIGPAEIEEDPLDVFGERCLERFESERNLDRRRAATLAKEEAARCFFRGRVKGMALESEDNPEPTRKHFQHFAAHIRASASPLTAVDAICYAYGLLQIDGESMDSVARRHKISRQAFSKLVQHVQQEFGISPRSGMRPVTQRRVYERVHRDKWEGINQDAPKQ